MHKGNSLPLIIILLIIIFVSLIALIVAKHDSGINTFSNKTELEKTNNTSPLPETETITRTVGDRESSFLIQKINSDSVNGLYYPILPATSSEKNQAIPKTIYIGDDIGYACKGISKKLLSIDYYNQQVTFSRIESDPPLGGCPI